MLEAILFDLDGTLVNTDPIHFKIWQEVLREYGLEIDEVFYQSRISGRLNPIIIKDILPHLSPEEGEKLAEDKEARFREMAELLKRLAGLDDVLAWTEKHGLKLALVTNAPTKNAHFMLSALGLAETFSTLVIADEVKVGKPDPAIYRLALNELNVTPEQALTFEDSPSGIRASVGAGIRTIGIGSTYDSKVLYDAGAFHVVPDFTDSSLWNLLVTGEEGEGRGRGRG